MTLQGLLFQFLDIGINAVQFLGDVDALRAVRIALTAACAVVGLPQLRYAPVITYQICAAGLPVFRRSG